MLFRTLLLSVLVALAVGLQACAEKPMPEESCSFVQNSDQQRVSWGASTPVVMYVDRSVPAEYYDGIKQAADVWNRHVGRRVVVIGGWIDSNSGAPAQDNQNVIYYLKTWEMERANEQARTTVYWAGDRIYEADIRLNAFNFEFFSSDEPIPGRVDIQSLVLHEMGHVLGLAHSEAPQSVMARSLPSAKLRRDLSKDDQKSIRCEY